MTTNPNDGGPAFPVDGFANIPDGEHSAYAQGMRLRDWFAGQALMGLIADPDSHGLDPADLAQDSYEIADAMLAARTPATER